MEMHLFIDFLKNLLLVLFHTLEGIVMFFVPSKWLAGDVRGKIVLITGGGSGIGQLMAVEMSRLGAKVVIWDVNRDGMAKTKNLADVHTYFCDISDRVSVYETAKKVKDEVGRVSILINNAGIVNGKVFLEIEDAKIDRTIQVNQLAHIWTTKAFLPDMIESSEGHLVYISSVAALTPTTHSTDYSASKSAVLTFCESLMLELRSLGHNDIKSTVVCPYFINTGLFTGASSSLVPFLEPDYVAEKIVMAIRCNVPVLILPWYFTFLSALKWLLPVPAQFALFDCFRGSEMMVGFTGRKS